MQFESSSKDQNDKPQKKQCICNRLNSIFCVRIAMSLYKKELVPMLQFKSIQIIRNLIHGYKSSWTIGFKDAMIFTQQKNLLSKYNSFQETSQVIKEVILSRIKQNLVKSVKFDKQIHNILVKHQTRKRQILKSKQTVISVKSKYIFGLQKQNSQKQILKEFNVDQKYNFKPVSPFSSKDSSTIMIQKLTRELSIMVQKVQTKQQNFPEISQKMFHVFDIKIPKEEIMFKKHLSNNFSEINEQKTIKTSNSVRLLTSPPQPLKNKTDKFKFQEDYGMSQNYFKLNKAKKRKSKSLIRKQPSQKSLTKIYPKNYMKQNSRMMTNQDSTRITNSRSKSKTKSFSKSKLIFSKKGFLDKKQKIGKTEKSLNKSKKNIRNHI